MYEPHASDCHRSLSLQIPMNCSHSRHHHQYAPCFPSVLPAGITTSPAPPPLPSLFLTHQWGNTCVSTLLLAGTLCCCRCAVLEQHTPACRNLLCTAGHSCPCNAGCAVTAQHWTWLAIYWYTLWKGVTHKYYSLNRNHSSTLPTQPVSQLV